MGAAVILVGLGANLPGPGGSPRATLEMALAALGRRGVRIAARSPFYESAPVPPSDQPWYVNAVARVETELPPAELLRLLLAVEADLGRVRGVRNAPRAVDLDLLAYGERVERAPGLVLPHPRLHERAFVLRPLADIAPGWRHPVTGQDVAALLRALPAGQAVRPLPGG